MDARVPKLKRHDPAEFRELYESNFDSWYGRAMLALGDHHAAEDVASDIAIAVFEGIDRFDPERGDLDGWIYRIAERKIIDRLRSDGRRRCETPEAIARLLERSGAGVELADVGWSDRTLLTQIRILPELQREVLYLRHLADLSPAGVGEYLGKSAAAVRQLDSKATRALAERLEASGHPAALAWRARIGEVRATRAAMRARLRPSPVTLSRRFLAWA